MRIDPAARAKELDELSVEKDHQRIVHLLAGYEFPWDLHHSLELALLRSYASTPVSRLLDATGEFQERGQKRYDDTALLVGEFMKNGYDSPRGSAAIKRMNELHWQYKIPNEDYLFILSTFVLDPIDWMSEYAWRPMTRREGDALFLFWKNVAERMGLTDIPSGLDELREFAVSYTEREFRFDVRNRRVADATLDIARHWLPLGTRWLVLPSVNALIDQPMRESFGLGRPSTPLRAILKTLLKLRGFAVSVLPKRRSSAFYCDKPTRTYRSDGYEVQHLGPEPKKKNTKNASVE